MSPAKRRVIVSLSCFLCCDSGSGACVSGWSSAGSFMICDVVPQEKKRSVERRIEIVPM